MFINLAKRIICIVIYQEFLVQKQCFTKKINISKRQNDNQVNSFFKLIYNIFLSFQTIKYMTFYLFHGIIIYKLKREVFDFHETHISEDLLTLLLTFTPVKDLIY
jgi:predicted CDP-diglyceride synthetase/phosphatidate cytidylyltransferase